VHLRKLRSARGGELRGIARAAAWARFLQWSGGMNIPSAAAIRSQVQSRISSQLRSRNVAPPVQRTPSVQRTSPFQRQYSTDAFEPSSRRAPVNLSGGTQQTTHSNPDAVAQQIAQNATGWNYDNSGGKTWDQTVANENNFDQSKSGVCVDMATEAAQEFEAQGVNARVVFGDTNLGGHAWVEYQEPDGSWASFDPTAAACSKNADAAITPMDNGIYQYGAVTDRFDPPAEG
jgi:transglutaminase-like putative cysteine protease